MSCQFPRISELASIHASNPDSRFYRFPDNQDLEFEQIRQAFDRLEQDLVALDDDSWAFLYKEAKDFAVLTSDTRGWNQLFEKLNEAKGYRFLAESGYSDLAFIPRAKKAGIETPDLTASKDGRRCFCEVKTINRSDEYYRRVAGIEVNDVATSLDEGMLKKVGTVLKKAISQLGSIGDKEDVRICYLVVNYDHPYDYVANYNAQIRNLHSQLSGDRLEIHVGT